MNINEFNKLEKNINNDNFSTSYKSINNILKVLSYFGNISSIFLAYFFMSTIMSVAFTNMPIVIFTVSLILLFGIELLKRDIFNKFSIIYLKVKKINNIVLPLLLSSLILIFLSFYSSLSGAKEFSSKTKQLETETNKNINLYSDSIKNIYDLDLSKINNTITNTSKLIEDKDNEQTIINSSLLSIGYITNAQKERNLQLINEKEQLLSQLNTYNNNIKEIKYERDSIISDYKNTALNELKINKKSYEKNSFIFVIISTLIEFIILGGVFFNEYYKLRSYLEFKTKLDNDTNYQTWKLYDSILKIIYPLDAKINYKLPTNRYMIDMCKINEIVILPKDMTNFLKIIESLNIIKTNTNGRHISKQRDISIEILQKSFSII